MTVRAQPRPPARPVSALGLPTIVAYGACYYAYSALIQPISAGTHWPDAALGAIFSAILLITGVGGLLAGRVLDRAGKQPLFLVAAIAGAGAMFVASFRVRCCRSPSPTQGAADWRGPRPARISTAR